MLTYIYRDRSSVFLLKLDVCFAVAAFLVSFLVLIEFQNKIFGYRSSDQRKISSKRVTLMSLVFLLLMFVIMIFFLWHITFKSVDIKVTFRYFTCLS